MATNSFVSKQIATLRNQSGPISWGALVTGPTGRSELQTPRAPGARTRAGHSFLQRPVAPVHPGSHLTAWLCSLHPRLCPTVIPQRPAHHCTRGPSADPRHRRMAQSPFLHTPKARGAVPTHFSLNDDTIPLRCLILLATTSSLAKSCQSSKREVFPSPLLSSPTLFPHLRPHHGLSALLHPFPGRPRLHALHPTHSPCPPPF